MVEVETQQMMVSDTTDGLDSDVAICISKNLKISLYHG